MKDINRIVIGHIYFLMIRYLLKDKVLKEDQWRIDEIEKYIFGGQGE